MDYSIYLDMDDVVAAFRRHCEAFFAKKADGSWNFYEQWGMTADQFWNEIDEDPFFWSHMPKTDQCDELVKLVETVDPDFNILTCPHDHEQCYAGKYYWAKKHLGFDNVARRLILDGAKWERSKVGRILIDDKPDNITKWKSGGGIGILWPADWNDNKGKDGIELVKSKLAGLDVVNGQFDKPFIRQSDKWFVDPTEEKIT